MMLDIIDKNGITVLRGLRNFNIETILECGQCFRWEKNNENDYTGIVGSKVIRISQKGDSAEFIGCTLNDFNEIWHRYFDMETDYGLIINTLSADDEVMRTAAGFAPGIRILRQPLFETLISFIISANNSIPNIKRIISALSSMYGEKIIFGNREYYSFPDPEVLAGVGIEDITRSKAGYRSQYIKKTATAYAKDPITVAMLKNMGYAEAKKKLMEYAGVGAKVADCTLLFSGSFTNAFPVDVWVKKVMEELYLKEDTPIKKISEYAIDKFGNLGGYAQQYLFFYARSNM